MTLRTKKLIQVVALLTLSTTYYLLPTAFAADVPPSPPGEQQTEAIRIPDVVAKVNGVDVHKNDLERRMAQSRAMNPERFDAMGPDQKKMAINRTINDMVMREVTYQEAVKREIAVTDDEVNMNLEGLKRQFPSEDAFKKAFSEANITIPAWKEETRKSLMAMKLEEFMVDELKISDNEIADYYEKNKEELNMDAVRISHILVDTEKKAKEVVKKLNKKKGDFGDLAEKYSLDTFTKDKGGELGWFGRGALVKEVEDAAFSLSPGQISKPVKSQFGYDIIRLDEKKTASEQTLDDHREHVRTILQQLKWQQWKPAWQSGLMENAEVWKWAP